MKLAALYVGGTDRSALFIQSGDGFVPVDAVAQAHGRPHLSGLADVKALLDLGPDAMAELASLEVPAAGPATAAGSARFAPPVRAPGKIICVGLNYLAHIEESRATRPERVVLFAKFPSCLIGHNAEIHLPGITSQLDYEGELAVVIGKKARRVNAGDALGYIGGFTVINDVSARDLQAAEPQWIRGKSLDTFAPLGPVLVDAGSAMPVEQMHIRTVVNGEVRQDASCSLMITPVPELVEYISAHITLEPGDIIATGTPAGVALGMEHPVYLADGDKVSIEISGIGELTSTVVAPPTSTR